MTKVRNVYPLIIISLIFLFNPSANLIDVLPDLVAYVMLIIAIGGLYETVPYLAECRSALIKLALVSVVKIPAFSLMYSNIAAGKDIIPLFTLVFVTLELILLYSAVTNGYNALAYLGERTDCRSVRESFSLGKNKKCSPEQLKILTYIFFAARGILNVVPEIFLLTPEDVALRKRLTEAYPAVLVVCILAALVIGAVWLKHATKYARAIKQGGDIRDAISYIDRVGTPEEISEKDKLKKLALSLTTLAFSGIFIFDIALSDFGGYNILPHFIYGILLFVSVYNFSKDKKLRSVLTVGAAGYSVVSLLVFAFTLRFFESFTYVDLKYSNAAKSLYMPVKLFAVLELIFALVTLVAATLMTVEFIKEHTDVSPSDPSYSKTNEKNHKRTVMNVLPVFVISAVIHILKCVNVFIKQSSVILQTDANVEGIAASGVPAMDTIIFLACTVYVICCFVKTSNLKDEVRFKYEKE